ncbi:nuclear transport factor 2 family protein [Polaromonas glacialis]|uniref:hypothetical protein n=1 Tax=Polaromonas glacialis TaxID=866564 RepID=UPI0004957070|nr:hypothetical protein [Polaromonas glacialis]
MSDQKSEIDIQCKKVLDSFMAALNAHDAVAMDAAMHFPHFRFTGSQVKVYDKAGSNPMDLFQKLQREDGWQHSTWRTRDLVQFSDFKSHYALSYTRFRSDGSIIGIYESLYVLTQFEGRWGIQMRSSFGP